MASTKSEDHQEEALPASIDEIHDIRPPSVLEGAPSLRRRLQVAIFVGGVVGALARAGLNMALPWDGRGWPWATFAANVVGTLALGYFVTRLQERLPPSTYRRPLLGTGFCGALTTFSTLQVELIQLARHGSAGLAFGYGLASLGAGLVGVYLATALTRRVRVR
jgi:CrcB protein